MNDRFDDSIGEALERLAAVQPATLARVRGSIRGLPERSPRGGLARRLRGRSAGLAAAAAACLVVAAVAFVAAPWRARVISPSQSALPTSAAVNPTASGTATTADPTPSPTPRPFADPGGFVQAMHRIDLESGWVLVSASHEYPFLKITDDGGETWRNATPPDSYAARPIVDFVDPAHGWFLQPAEPDGAARLSLWRTSDGGRRWQAVDLPAGVSDVQSMSYVTSSLGFVLASMRAGRIDVYRSDDGGSSWHRAGGLPGATKIADGARSAFAFSDGSNGFLMASPPLSTYDGGRTWTRLALPIPSSPAGATFHAANVAVAAGVVLVSGMRTWPLGNDRTDGLLDLYVSRDGGRTWESPAGAPTVGYSSSVDAISSRTWVVVPDKFDGGKVVGLTDDSGSTWLEIGNLPVDRHYIAVSFADASNGWAVLAQDPSCPFAVSCPYAPPFDGALYETTDGGRTWRAATNVP